MSNPKTSKYTATDERKEQARKLVKDFLHEQNIFYISFSKDVK